MHYERHPRRGVNPSPDPLRDEFVRLTERAALFQEAAAERLGLNVTDLRCLAMAHAEPGMTASRLAELSGLTSGAITGVLDRLERANLVRREADPADRRRTLVRGVPGREQEFRDTYGPIETAIAVVRASARRRSAGWPGRVHRGGLGSLRAGDGAASGSHAGRHGRRDVHGADGRRRRRTPGLRLGRAAAIPAGSAPGSCDRRAHGRGAGPFDAPADDRCPRRRAVSSDILGAGPGHPGQPGGDCGGPLSHPPRLAGSPGEPRPEHRGPLDDRGPRRAVGAVRGPARVAAALVRPPWWRGRAGAGPAGARWHEPYPRVRQPGQRDAAASRRERGSGDRQGRHPRAATSAPSTCATSTASCAWRRPERERRRTATRWRSRAGSVSCGSPPA